MLKKLPEHAIYTPAISAGYAKIGYSQSLKRQYPFPEAALNFLDPGSQLFYHPYALYSAGQAAQTNGDAKQVSIARKSQRKTKQVVIVGDSGGYQIQQGTMPFEGSKTCERILRWLEAHADYSMTLDFPTGGIGSSEMSRHLKRLESETRNTPYDLATLCAQNGHEPEYNACLAQSLINLDYFVKNRHSGKTKFLNVLQGRNEAESKTWYEAVKGYNLEGWAFAGEQQFVLSMILSRLVDMWEDGYLQKAEWIHFLGISTLPAAHLFTALLRSIRKINPRICISFDSASPFKSAANYQFFAWFRYDQYGRTLKSYSFSEKAAPSDQRTLNDLCDELTLPIIARDKGGRELAELIPFAAKTAIGEKLKVSDFFDPKETPPKMDAETIHLLMNHNVQVYTTSFDEVAKSYDYNQVDDDFPVQARLIKLRMKEILKNAFRGKITEARDAIKRYADTLNFFAEERWPR